VGPLKGHPDDCSRRHMRHTALKIPTSRWLPKYHDSWQVAGNADSARPQDIGPFFAASRWTALSQFFFNKISLLGRPNLRLTVLGVRKNGLGDGGVWAVVATSVLNVSIYHGIHVYKHYFKINSLRHAFAFWYRSCLPVPWPVLLQHN